MALPEARFTPVTAALFERERIHHRAHNPFKLKVFYFFLSKKKRFLPGSRGDLYGLALNPNPCLSPAD
jgi:hypothetical protein